MEGRGILSTTCYCMMQTWMLDTRSHSSLKLNLRADQKLHNKRIRNHGRLIPMYVFFHTEQLQ